MKLHEQEAPRRTSLHRRASSTINEDLLQGLLQRDAPRIEVLSEALQRGPVGTAADQLAALSEVSWEARPACSGAMLFLA